MGEERFLCVPFDNLPIRQVTAYWEALQDARLLKYRFTDHPSPDLVNVVDMHACKGNMCFYMIEEDTGKIAAETMLNNFSGLCAQVHFSVHPAYRGPTAIEIGKAGARAHFNMKHNPTGERITTLIGMTPANNRLAVNFITKIGFKKLDIISKMFYNELSKKYYDGFISKLTPKDITDG